MKTFLKLLFLTILCLTFFKVLIIGWKWQEEKECNNLKKQEQDYPQFYSNEWMREQCQIYNITFNR